MNKRLSTMLAMALVASDASFEIRDKRMPVERKLKKLIRNRYDDVPQSEQNRRIGEAQAKRDRKNIKRLREASDG